ncbi:protein FAM200B-like, partial [Aphis craccivora]
MIKTSVPNLDQGMRKQVQNLVNEENVDDPSSSGTTGTTIFNQPSTSSQLTYSEPEPAQKSIRPLQLHYHHFSLVEEKEFKNLVHLLAPGYTLPNRKTIANTICLTTDAWTSINNQSFIALTAHYTDDNTNLGCFAHSINLVVDSGLGYKDVNDIILKFLCETRWVEKHDCIMQFSSNLVLIIEALDKISEWNDLETSSKTSILIKSLSNAEFILTLNVMPDIFSITAPISRILQSKSQDKFSASKLINNVLIILKEKRKNSAENFNLIFNNSIQCLEKIGIVDPKEKLQKEIIHQLKTQKIIFVTFDEKSVSVFNLDIILSTFIHNKEVFNNQNKINNMMAQFCELIEIPKTSLEAFERCDSETFPIVYNCFLILLTLPATSATAERNFCSLRRLKTWMRSRISEERLNGLALLNCYRNISIDCEEVIDEFAKSKRRKDFV